jgi:hypothetical protein
MCLARARGGEKAARMRGESSYIGAQWCGGGSAARRGAQQKSCSEAQLAAYGMNGMPALFFMRGGIGT